MRDAVVRRDIYQSLAAPLVLVRYGYRACTSTCPKYNMYSEKREFMWVLCNTTPSYCRYACTLLIRLQIANRSVRLVILSATLSYSLPDEPTSWCFVVRRREKGCYPLAVEGYAYVSRTPKQGESEEEERDARRSHCRRYVSGLEALPTCLWDR